MIKCYAKTLKNFLKSMKKFVYYCCKRLYMTKLMKHHIQNRRWDAFIFQCLYNNSPTNKRFYSQLNYCSIKFIHFLLVILNFMLIFTQSHPNSGPQCISKEDIDHTQIYA